MVALERMIQPTVSVMPWLRSTVLVISLACGLGLGNRERVKCQVQSHKIGASACDMRMLPFLEEEAKSPGIYIPGSLEEACLTPARLEDSLVSQPLIFPL